MAKETIGEKFPFAGITKAEQRENGTHIVVLIHKCIPYSHYCKGGHDAIRGRFRESCIAEEKKAPVRTTGAMKKLVFIVQNCNQNKT